jgi:ferredoxin-NADP reductase
MAEIKRARLVDSAMLASETRWMQLMIDSTAQLGFRGGQFIAVDTGLSLPNGKPAKRAYSIASCDAEQRLLELVVTRIGQGVVSNHMHALEVGAELHITGPWGKFCAPQANSGQTLVLATDTGITAALGLVRSLHFAALRTETTFVWLRPSPNRLMPDAWVRERLPRDLDRVHIAGLPGIGDASRVAFVRDMIGECLSGRDPVRAFISGDGSVNYALLDDLSQRGVSITRDEVESFFNMPKK